MIAIEPEHFGEKGVDSRDVKIPSHNILSPVWQQEIIKKFHKIVKRRTFSAKKYVKFVVFYIRLYKYTYYRVAIYRSESCVSRTFELALIAPVYISLENQSTEPKKGRRIKIIR